MVVSIASVLISMLFLDFCLKKILFIQYTEDIYFYKENRDFIEMKKGIKD